MKRGAELPAELLFQLGLAQARICRFGREGLNVIPELQVSGNVADVPNAVAIEP